MSSHSAVMLLRMMHAFHFGSADNYGGFFILTKARLFSYTYRASAKGGIYFRANSGKFCLLPEETFRLSAFAVQPARYEHQKSSSPCTIRNPNKKGVRDETCLYRRRVANMNAPCIRFPAGSPAGLHHLQNHSLRVAKCPLGANWESWLEVVNCLMGCKQKYKQSRNTNTVCCCQILQGRNVDGRFSAW